MKSFLYISCFALILTVGSGFRSLKAYHSGNINQKDSLLLVVQTQHLDDSLRMDAYLRLGRISRFYEPIQALDYIRKGLHIAENLNYSQIAGNALADIGLMYWRLSNFNLAYDFFYEAGLVFEEIDDRAGYARVLNSIGSIFSRKGYQDQALDYFLQALQIYEELDSLLLYASVLNNIGMVHLDQKNYELSEQYHRRSMSIKEVHDDIIGKAFSLNNLGTIKKRTGKYEEALAFYNESLGLRKEIGGQLEIANTTRNIAYLYFLIQEYDKAIELLEHALVLYEKAGHRADMANADYILGVVYAAQGDMTKSRHFFQLSLVAAEQLELTALVSDNYNALSELYASLGDFAQAYAYQKKHIELQESIFDAETTRRVVELRFLQEREQRENEIQLLRKTNQIIELNYDKQGLFRNFLLLFITLILIILVIIYFRFIEYKRTNAILKKQKEEIATSNKKLKELNLSLFEQQKKEKTLNNQLKESQKKLITINNTKDRFFSIISHDLRSPFASIVSFSRILKRDIDMLSKEELSQLVSELDQSVIKINNLLDNLLQWSRTQTGKMKFQPEAFALKEIVADNINLFASNAREKEIELIEDVEQDVIVFADVNMTDTILRNLISNALKYTHPGGKVTVSVCKDNKFAKISVSDTGVGIPEKDQKHLLRSDRLHSTYGTRDEKGSGLGLILCREFIGKQGGTLIIKSEVGKGSVFTFTLPMKNV